MNASNTTAGFERRRVVLSTLWIFALLNYIYADVYTLFFNPVLQPEADQEVRGRLRGGHPDHPGVCSGDGDPDGDRHRHGSAVPRVALSRKPVGEHPVGRATYPVRRLVADRRHADQLLCDVRGDRGYLHPVHRLVCLEVARPCQAGGAVPRRHAGWQ